MAPESNRGVTVILVDDTFVYSQTQQLLAMADICFANVTEFPSCEPMPMEIVIQDYGYGFEKQIVYLAECAEYLFEQLLKHISYYFLPLYSSEPVTELLRPPTKAVYIRHIQLN